LAEGGPRAVAELPADLAGFERAGERWLARGHERLVLFHLDEAGSFQLDLELSVRPEVTRAPRLSASDTRLLLHSFSQTGGPGAGTEHRVAAVEVGPSSLSVQVGPPLAGSPNGGFASTGRGLFALTVASDLSDAHVLLERVDLAADQSEVVAFAERPAAATLQGEARASLRVRY